MAHTTDYGFGALASLTPPPVVTGEPRPVTDRTKPGLGLPRVRPRRPVSLTQKGAEKRLAQEFAAGRISRQQFLAGVGALSKATVGAKASSVTDIELGLRPQPVPSPLVTTPRTGPIAITNTVDPYRAALERRAKRGLSPNNPADLRAKAQALRAAAL